MTSLIVSALLLLLGIMDLGAGHTVWGGTVLWFAGAGFTLGLCELAGHESNR